MAAKIKKGDKVVVITGRDKGRSGEVAASSCRRGPGVVRGVNMVTATSARPEPARKAASSRKPRPPFQRRAHRSEGRQADARRFRSSNDGKVRFQGSGDLIDG